MTSYHRAMLFCVTTLLLAPALYGLGEWLGGPLLGSALTGVAWLASFTYMRMGEDVGSAHPSADAGPPAIAAVPPDSGRQPPRDGRRGPDLPKAA